MDHNNQIDLTISVVNALPKILKKEGIDCRSFFCPMHLQPVFKKMKFFKNQKFPVSEELFKRGFYIPSGIGTTKNEMRLVVEKMKKIFNK